MEAIEAWFRQFTWSESRVGESIPLSLKFKTETFCKVIRKDLMILLMISNKDVNKE